MQGVVLPLAEPGTSAANLFDIAVVTSATIVDERC
jgi:hypothetical protein